MVTAMATGRQRWEFTILEVKSLCFLFRSSTCSKNNKSGSGSGRMPATDAWMYAVTPCQLFHSLLLFRWARVVCESGRRLGMVTARLRSTGEPADRSIFLFFFY